MQTGAFAALHAGNAATDAIVNKGFIKAADDGGSFAIDGASFTNAGTITVSNGDTLAVENTILINTGHLSAGAGGPGQAATQLSFQGPVVNTGTILAAAGTTSFSENVTGAGQLQIGAAGTLALLAGAVAGQAVDFLAAGGQLAITNPSVFDAAITNWGAGDRIDLVNTVSNADTFANGTLSVLEAGQVVAALRFEGAYTQGSFTVTTDDVGGTAITFV